MPLQRLAGRLLADLLPVLLRAFALLLRQREAFGADRADEGEIIRRREIVEIFRILLEAALRRVGTHDQPRALRQLRQGLAGPLHLLAQNLGEERISALVSWAEALDRGFAIGGGIEGEEAARQVIVRQKPAAGSGAAL